jgi:hypothetical protein
LDLGTSKDVLWWKGLMRDGLGSQVERRSVELELEDEELKEVKRSEKN